MRKFTSIAKALFEEAVQAFLFSVGFNEVEFDVECSINDSERHTRDCRIARVTVRYMKSGPDSDDVFSFLPGRIESAMAAVRMAHDEAFLGK